MATTEILIEDTQERHKPLERQIPPIVGVLYEDEKTVINELAVEIAIERKSEEDLTAVRINGETRFINAGLSVPGTAGELEQNPSNLMSISNGQTLTIKSRLHSNEVSITHNSRSKQSPPKRDLLPA